MKQVLLAFLSQNIRRFFWLTILILIIGTLFLAGDKAEALKWLGILGGVALTQIKSNTAVVESKPKEKKNE